MAFTPVEAAAGGLAIGLAVFWNARINGRVTGISGALNSAITCDPLAFAFVTGLITGGITIKHLFPTRLEVDPLIDIPNRRLLLAAVLVGVGTRLANGCTSGHGVCGLARLSKRSAAATAIFFVVAVFTATSFHSARFHTLADVPSTDLSFSDALRLPPEEELRAIVVMLLAAAVLPVLVTLVASRDGSTRFLHEMIQYLLGLIFAAGLIISGMANPAKTLGFLDLEASPWDPSLAFVFVGALPPAFIGFRPLLRGAKPKLAPAHCLPSRSELDVRLLAGSILFGVGWGLIGLCPGPALVYFGAYPFSYTACVFLLAMTGGSVFCKMMLAGLGK